MTPSFLRILKNSLSAKLILAAVTLITGTTLALNYYFYIQQKAKLTDNLLFHGRSLAKILAHDSRLGVFTDDPLELSARAQLIAEEQDCRLVIIYDLNGRPLIRLDGTGRAPTAASPALLSSPEIFKRIPALMSAQSPVFSNEKAIILVERVAVALSYSEEALFIEDELLHAVNTRQPPVQKAAEAIGYVAVVMSCEGIEQKAWSLLRQSATVSLAITLISCGLIFLIIQSLTSPLTRLTTEITSHQQLTGQSPPEHLRHHDFQGMIATIKESFRTIEELKDNLEIQVQHRTQELNSSNTELAAQKIDLERANQQLSNTLHELQKTQEQLVQSEKMAALGQLISGLSHEIYNSLNFISTSLPLLEKNLAALPPAAPPPAPDASSQGRPARGSSINTETLLSHIKEGVRRITGVVNDLRIFSYHKAESFEKMDLEPGLRASISILRHEHRNRIEFREEFEAPLPMAEVLGGQINQVFMNMLLNAIQAIPESGVITVKAWSTPDKLHVSITDSGCGIAETELSKIFDPFYTTKSVGMGTGMGLSLSYSIVKKHHGQIRVDSTTGKGTIFEIILPLRQEKAVP